MAHQEGPLRGQAPGPAADQGEDLPHRLRGPAGDHRHPPRGRQRGPGQGTAAQRRPGLPGLRQPRRGQLQVREGAARDSRHRAISTGAGYVAGPQRPGSAGVGCPVASPGRGRPTGRGAPLRCQGAASNGQGRVRRRPRGGHGQRQAPENPLPGGHPPRPPLLRGPHPHGQVHPDAAHRGAPAAGEGRREERRRHHRHRPPRRPGGGHPEAGARGDHRPGVSHRLGRRGAGAGHQPAGRPGLRRPGPHRRLGGAHRPRLVGTVGAQDAVHPGAHRQEPPRVQQPPGHAGGPAADHPGRAAAAGGPGLPQAGAAAGGRPLHPGLVGQGAAHVGPGDPVPGPGPGADPPGLLLVLQEGPCHPGPAPLHHRPAEGHRRGRGAAGVHLPIKGGEGRVGPGGSVAAQPGGRGDPGAGRPARGSKDGAHW